jgi:hypothetical protein
MPAATAALAVSRAGAGTAWGWVVVVGVGREGRKPVAKAAPATRTPPSTPPANPRPRLGGRLPSSPWDNDDRASLSRISVNPRIVRRRRTRRLTPSEDASGRCSPQPFLHGSPEGLEQSAGACRVTADVDQPAVSSARGVENAAGDRRKRSLGHGDSGISGRCRTVGGVEVTLVCSDVKRLVVDAQFVGGVGNAWIRLGGHG